ncbi:MAG TPA: metallophosphoesterase [Terriglobales bacterium]|nr:metallophosphoesterase [Terriglobales bacterium]
MSSNSHLQAPRFMLGASIRASAMIAVSLGAIGVLPARAPGKFTLLFASAASAQPPAPSQPLDLRIPLEKNSVRFVAIGDFGNATPEQYAVARQMELYRQVVKYEFVITLGDNIYGGHSASDFQRKFEEPYKPLLDAGVKFYASLGNHDDPEVEIRYPPFNMNGQRYYTFSKGDVEFFALDSNSMAPKQLDWVTRQLQNSKAKWKIAYFHHPLYSDAWTHGSDLHLRARLQPLFELYKVNVVLSGHDHVYERLKPQGGIYYFVEGDSGQLRRHDLRKNTEMEAGGDTDRSFMLIEITADKFYFQVITGGGITIDSGMLPLQNTLAAAVASSQLQLQAGNRP